jgi:hypothetical protein
MIRIKPSNPQKLRFMETFRDPQTLEALNSTPNERFIAHGPSGGAPSPQNSFSDYYQRMLWLLPDEVCDHVLSGWMQVIHAKKSSSEPFPNLWLYFLDTYRLSSRSHKSGKSKPGVVGFSEALTSTSKCSASAVVDLQYSLRRSYYRWALQCNEESYCLS